MKEGEKNTDKALKEILNENDFPFVKDYKVFRTLGLKPLETAILNEILSFNMHGQEYTGSFTYIQKEFNVSKDTAIRALKKLVNDGYLIKNASKGGNTSIYSINELKIKSLFLNSCKIRELEEQTVANLEGKQSQNQTVNSRKFRHNKNIYKNNNKNIYAQSKIDASNSLSQEDDTSNTKKEADTKVPTSKKDNTPSKREQEEKYLQMFNEFWKLYPKKRDKANARKKWLKLKPNDELFKTIISALTKQIQSEQWQKDNGQYIPYPTTWINGERWEDEIKEAAGNSQPQEVQPPAYKLWNGDEEDEPKSQLTEAEKAELEKRAKEARKKLNSLANIITRN
ncbi:helix-turn-helix domain-containing protein [Megamonas hypermegale]|uniref:helix-turn-helix domain-containing protein n=1 Tax=Megamonas hypermegale TaxID=158847 RepID=UPI0026F36FFC|nr:helix-turn-helix domain-containing protein [Megamonas hypermegale]